MPITFETVHKCVSTQNTNGHEVLCWQSQIFYIYKLYLFFSLVLSFMYSLFDSHICCSTNAYEVITASHKDFTFCILNCFFTLMTTYGFIVWQIYFFSLFLPVTFELYTHVYLYNILHNQWISSVTHPSKYQPGSWLLNFSNQLACAANVTNKASPLWKIP